MNDKIFKLISELYLYFTIDDRMIDQEFVLKSLNDYLKTRGSRWKVKYLFFKLKYCSNRFKAIYGSKLYEELAYNVFKFLDDSEAIAKKKIEEAMTKFFTVN